MFSDVTLQIVQSDEFFHNVPYQWRLSVDDALVLVLYWSALYAASLTTIVLLHALRDKVL